MSNGIVFDIKEFAVFDGPGIRTTVFMKGCPLRCEWCHNPEGLSVQPQLMVSQAACVHCGACEKVCESPEKCVACGKCVPVCRGNFRKIIGTRWEARELAARLEKDRDVYEMSGGGVTFSGGEPLLQWPFLKEVMEQLHHVHRAVETSGAVPDEVFLSAMNTCDLVMMDWKCSDPAKLKRYTGADHALLLRHAKMLCEGSTPFILRLPVIPGVNDVREHFEFAAELVRNAPSLVRVDLLPYQRAAGAKYEMVGKTYAPTFDESAAPRMFTECFEEKGIPYQLFR